MSGTLVEEGSAMYLRCDICANDGATYSKLKIKTQAAYASHKFKGVLTHARSRSHKAAVVTWKTRAGRAAGDAARGFLDAKLLALNKRVKKYSCEYRFERKGRVGSAPVLMAMCTVCAKVGKKKEIPVDGNCSWESQCVAHAQLCKLHGVYQRTNASQLSIADFAVLERVDTAPRTYACLGFFQHKINVGSKTWNLTDLWDMTPVEDADGRPYYTLALQSRIKSKYHGDGLLNKIVPTSPGAYELNLIKSTECQGFRQRTLTPSLPACVHFSHHSSPQMDHRAAQRAPACSKLPRNRGGQSLLLSFGGATGARFRWLETSCHRMRATKA
ncbi:MAG: hypothetical protein CMJ86_05785 [Planctomycetes bacterium]|nr:hypothetical protein [Planctomycetota bacterium]